MGFIRGAIAAGVAAMVGIGLHQIGAGVLLSAGVALALYLFLAFSPLERIKP